jgi:hypothetical protein
MKRISGVNTRRISEHRWIETTSLLLRLMRLDECRRRFNRRHPLVGHRREHLPRMAHSAEDRQFDGHANCLHAFLDRN